MASLPPFNDGVAALRTLLAASRSAVALTGAGISTESGIPDFRSPGGIWSRMKPITYGEFVASEEARMEDWRRRFRMNADFAAAEPNAGHLVLAAMGSVGTIAALVTQNIDGLHQRAGFPAERLIEIHGNSTHGRCLDCRRAMSLDAVRSIIDATGHSPRCRCGGLVKAAIVSFGERLPEAVLAWALDLSRSADLFIVIGSSLLVRPAATLPIVAKRSGAKLVIVNRDPTPLDAEADLLITAPIGSTFSALQQPLAN